jgi:hypothetical protein
MTLKPSKSLHGLLFLLTSIVLVVGAVDAQWSLSIDLAHHYALIARLTEQWSLPYAGDASLGEMNYYPRLSHILAAVVGRFMGSAFMGMQVSALLSITLLWGSLITLVLSLPHRAALAGAFILSIGLWANHNFLHFQLHAAEIIGNFFYAQFVAQAFAIFILALTLRLERAGCSSALRYAMLGLAIYIAASIHLLPALELLAFFAALVSLELWQQYKAGRFNWINASLSMAWVITTSVALYRHPSWAVMNNLSGNNGGMDGAIQSMGAFLAYSALLIAGSLGVLSAWVFCADKRYPQQWVAMKYIGLYGLAVAALCLLQVIALQLGHGSEYAVKKYVFALNTLALIELILLLVWLLQAKMPALMNVASARSPEPWLAPLLLIIAFYSVTPSKALLETSRLVSLERELLLRRDLFMPSLADKYNYVHNIKNLPPMVDYIMSIGILKAPRATTQQISKTGWNWNLVGTLVTSEHDALDQDPECRRGESTGTLVMLDGACLAKRYPPRHIIGFTSNHPPIICTPTGFSIAEEFGTWTEASQSSLRCPLPPANQLTTRTISISAFAFLNRVPVQRLVVGIQGEAPTEYRFDASHSEQVITLKLPANAQQEVLINLSLPDAISPQQLGLGPDNRKLGISLQTLEFK